MRKTQARASVPERVGVKTPVLVGLAAWLSAGCAYVPAVKLTLPPEPERMPAASIVINDGRPLKQLTMQTITYDASNAAFSLAPVPPIDDALRLHLRSHLAASNVGGVPTLQVTLKAVELLNRVGFAKVDKITCTVVSTLRLDGSAHEVKTVSFTNDNTSPFVATAAQVSLNRCLAEHAKQILIAAKFL